MPCTSGYDSPSEEEYKRSVEAVNARQREVDAVTNYLCQLCTLLDDTEIIEGIPGLREWWTKHQEVDRNRKKNGK